MANPFHANTGSELKHPSPLARTLQEKLDYDQLTNCMRCGFCLPACPTFRETGIEPESPRGRIALMKAVADGLMEPDEQFREQMDHCLGCRACEPACPADVKYGQLIEQARDAIEDHSTRGIPAKMMRKLFLKNLFPHRNRLRRVGQALRFYQSSRLRHSAGVSGIMRLLPASLREMEQILPEASPDGVVERLGNRYIAKGAPLARVALFRGCMMDLLFADTNVNTVKLLSEAGFDVVIPSEQVCCGALHAHSGELDAARSLAKTNISIFEETGAEFIVSNAGGCGALLSDTGHLLHEDPDWADRAAAFASRIVDVGQLIVERGRIPRFKEPAGSSAGPVTVTYQDSCHLLNVMHSGSAPRQLIKQVDNIRYHELEEAGRCCGSAGIYNLTQPQMAGQILEHKMEHVNAAGAHYLLTSNPGCLLQMKLGVHKHGQNSSTEVMHLVDFLFERLETADNRSLDSREQDQRT